MAKSILSLVDGSGSVTKILYDNANSRLVWESTGVPVIPVQEKFWSYNYQDAQDAFGKKQKIQHLKISLGLSCNYSCSYCSQRFEPHTDSGAVRLVPKLLEQLNDLDLEELQRIEFWGGEPFVYWKALKPLSEALIERYPNAVPSIITNGSLLTLEKNEWLDRLGFSVGISHDGPGYHVRGLDPLSIDSQKQIILDLYNRLHPKGRISLNAVLHKDNLSRAAVQTWLENHFGADVVIGEGGFIDAYSTEGLASMLSSHDEVSFRKKAFFELKSGKAMGFSTIGKKVNDFIESIEYARPSTAVGQKCGMDQPNKLAIDMEGNVLTCQNVSAASIAQNGQSHKLGHITNLDSVRLTTSTHWSNRPGCSNCPVLQICKGSCMFLEGEYWESSCNAAYSDNVAILAYALYRMTGMTLVHIEGDGLSESRKNLWKVVEAEKPRKVIPIKQVG